MLAQCDMFSLGKLTLELFKAIKQGRQMDSAQGRTSIPTLHQAIQDASNPVPSADMAALPATLSSMVAQCTTSYGPRPAVAEFLKCEFFHDMQAKCLQFLEAFANVEVVTA